MEAPSFFKHGCMGTWAWISSWQMREERGELPNFNAPGAEVAHITSAYIPLALLSREAEKQSLALCMRRRGYGFGCTHACRCPDMKSFVWTGWTQHSASQQQLLKADSSQSLRLSIGWRKSPTSLLSVVSSSPVPCARAVPDNKCMGTSGHKREQSCPCSSKPQLSGHISNTSSTDSKCFLEVISLNQTKPECT